MEKERVYIETSFVSVLTARPTKDVLQIARQIESHEWWDNHREGFELFISQVVIDEVSQGDRVAAESRLELLKGIPFLEIASDAEELFTALMSDSLLPDKASDDAMHIAVCACNGMDYLLTWNCKHLANAVIARNVYRYLEKRGYQPPLICTPSELME